MIDPKSMLDALIGAASRHGQGPSGSGTPGQKAGGRMEAGRGAGAPPAQPSDNLLATARDIIARNPKLSEAAILGLVGLVFGKRKGGGLSSRLGRLGGLAAIGGLAYKAYQSWRSPSSASPSAAPSTAPSGGPAARRTGLMSSEQTDIPEGSHFHPVSQTEDDALLYLRAMVAAASADGQVDGDERERILKGMAEAGIDAAATRWLQDELASPADVEELAATVNTPEKAAQVYAAARIAIEPDTMQEREFLRQLATALDLDEAFRARIEDTIEGLR
ncbi:MAG: tellurite resistance TerB family protein [Microvirga sp.]